MALDQHVIEAAGLALAFAVTKTLDHLKGKKRDTRNGNSIRDGFDGLSQKIDSRTADLRMAMDLRFDQSNERMNQLEANVTEVKTICVGFDGKNGLRSDIGRLTQTVEAMEVRERERLEAEALGAIVRGRRRTGG